MSPLDSASVTFSLLVTNEAVREICFFTYFRNMFCRIEFVFWLQDLPLFVTATMLALSEWTRRSYFSICNGNGMPIGSSN